MTFEMEKTKVILRVFYQTVRLERVFASCVVARWFIRGQVTGFKTL